MGIHQIVKDAIKQHTKELELIQWGIIAGISSLVYSKYISEIKVKQTPRTRLVLVPELKVVKKLLDRNGIFIKDMSDHLIDRIKTRLKFSDLNCLPPELALFSEDNIETLKTVFDLYMIPNIIKRIPETIVIKFQLNDPNQQTFRENPDTNPWYLNTYMHTNFITEQTFLQLLMLSTSIPKETTTPERNYEFTMTKYQILTINNENAICPIHFNNRIIDDFILMKLFSFVTSTHFEVRDKTVDSAGTHNNSYTVNTSMFNTAVLTTIGSVVTPLNEKEINNG